MKVLFVALMVSITCTLMGQPSILPQPQEISFGNKFLLIKGLSVVFKNPPTKEDSFASVELVRVIEEKTSLTMPVGSGATKAKITLERIGTLPSLPQPDEPTGKQSREAYSISIKTNGINIRSYSSAGLFYAVQTLRQLVVQRDGVYYFPEAEITDWPSMAYRGFMMDMSHMQLPRIEEIKRQIDFLAMWKGNQYYFYSEGSIEMEGFPLLMRKARFTKSEVKEIIEYAKNRHIDVVPNMELYGHTHDLLKLEHYTDLAVVPHGGEFKPTDEKVQLIVNDWIKQMADLFPSKFFHIGFDETFLLEKEAKKLNRAPDDLYIEMLNKTVFLVNSRGKIPMVYADMLQQFPRSIPSIKQKFYAVPWHYFALTKEDYKKNLKPFSDNNVQMILQGASVNWNWVVPAYELSFANTDSLITAGKKYGAIGYITSGWTDDTQTLMRLAFPDIAYGAAASWQNTPINRNDFFNTYSRAQYSESDWDNISKAHTALMKAENLIRGIVGDTDPAFWGNPFDSTIFKKIRANIQNLKMGRLEAEKAKLFLYECINDNGPDSAMIHTLLTGAAMLDYLAVKCLYANEIFEFWQEVVNSTDKEKELRSFYMEVVWKFHTRTSDMQDFISETKTMFKQAWLSEYTPFRLEIAMRKYDMELEFWIHLQRRLEEIYINYSKNKKLPEWESIINIE
jgi:hypothetical protein